MKKYLLLLFIGFSVLVKAQDNKIIFDYDGAGNQIKRELCIGCTKPNYKTASPKEITALKEEDLLKFSPQDNISYYPNPVKEELYVKWELINDNTVTALQVYSLNGQVLQSYANMEQTNAKNLPFQSYPSGTYLIVLTYRNGEQKSIKIIKQ